MGRPGVFESEAGGDHGTVVQRAVAERFGHDVPVVVVTAAELAGGHMYLYLPHGSAGSKLGGNLLERRLGAAMTSRNWRTVQALREMTGP